MNRPRPVPTILLGLAATALITFQILGPRPARGFLVDSVFDAGHAVLFGAFAVVLLELLRARGRSGTARGGPAPKALYVTAWLLTGLAGAATEALQYRGPRDADLMDLGRDLLGGAAALLLHAALRPDVARRARGAMGVTALVLMVAGTWPLWTAATIHVGRASGAPALADWDAYWSRSLVLTRDADVTWPRDARGERSARVIFGVGKYPAFILRQPLGDWTGYERLRFSVASELDADQRIILRIADGPATEDYRDQFQTAIQVQPGGNEITIRLSEVIALNGRRLDLTRVRSLVFFEVEPAEPFTLSFGDLLLQ